MTREEIKEVFENTLVSIYMAGYNKAIEDVSDYLYSPDRPNLRNEQLAKLDSDIREMKKHETNRK